MPDSLMARSRTRSKQRPDTLMQDRISQVEEASCTALPDHTFGSKCEELEPSISGPLLPSKADVRADVSVGRIRALALFGRRPPQRVVRSSLPASENLHKKSGRTQEL